MAQMSQLSNMITGMSLGDGSSYTTPTPRTAQSTNNGSGGNRLPIALKKYQNPAIVRPPNQGLAAHQATTSGSKDGAEHGEATQSNRAPLLRLAGLNVPSPARPKHSSPKGKPSLSQHTAHGLHGPAHSTTSRTMSSVIGTTSTHAPARPSVIKKPQAQVPEGGIGRYDGGLEADEANREAVTGDAAKVLEMDSAQSSGCVIQL